MPIIFYRINNLYLTCLQIKSHMKHYTIKTSPSLKIIQIETMDIE